MDARCHPAAILLSVSGFIILATGCGASSRYERRATYSDEYAGYVVKRQDGAAPMVLVNPITSEKFRCKEELEPWMESVARVEGDAAYAEDVMFWSSVACFPATVVYCAACGLPTLASGSLVYAPGLHWFWGGLQDLRKVRSENAFKTGDWKTCRDAAREYLLTSRPTHRPRDEHWYIFAVCSSRLGDSAAAVQGYRNFLRRAQTSAPEKYQEARVAIGEEPPCISQAPIEIDWPE